MKAKDQADRSPGIFIKGRYLFSFFLLLVISLPTAGNGVVNSLRGQGFSLIPAPQKVALTGNALEFGRSWTIESKLDENSIVLKTLRGRAKVLHDMDFRDQAKDKIIIEIRDGILPRDIDPGLAVQGYLLQMERGTVKITGSSENGLFYGIQSFLQLLKPSVAGTLLLPEGTVTDWPDLELRVIHWDTKHHQDRIETLKRYIDEAASFKANAIAFEIEDKYEYPSHPVIGAPGAFTKAQMQELTAYALERFIQLIPMVQAPAHMAYVLKHPEFAHLRADSSNYQICMCDDEAIKLIFDMYQDMIDATPGVKYFLVSTDEIYFAGICGKCKKPYNDHNRSLTWVDFVKKANKFMEKHGRKMISWIEYPLQPEDIRQLPANMIDGVISTGKEQEWIDEEKKRGIKGLVYNSIQGSEYLFPNYFPTTYRGREIEGNLRSTSLSTAIARERGANIFGSFTAGWDDSGLHNELFWLGWITGLQYSWTIGKPGTDQSVADFMDVFYGYGVNDMVEIYRLLEEGARFYQDLWDRVVSRERGPGYGDWMGKGINTERYDLTLETLPIPGLISKPVFSAKYANKIREAAKIKRDNERLMQLLMHNLTRVEYNRYNLEVLLAIAFLERYTVNTLSNWVSIENYLIAAYREKNDFQEAVDNMIKAWQLAGKILDGEKDMMEKLTTVWEKSRYKKCRTVDGKEFYHVLDDLKDHFADRRTDLGHMLAPFQRMEIEKWQSRLKENIFAYAKRHGVEVRGLGKKSF